MESSKWRLKEALELSSYRSKSNGGKAISQQQLGKALSLDSKFRNRATKMHRLVYGIVKSIKFRDVSKICEVLGVDANFLFGQESKHDQEYNELTTKND